MDSTPPLEHLSPPSVWRHFATLCRPRVLIEALDHLFARSATREAA